MKKLLTFGLIFMSTVAMADRIVPVFKKSMQKNDIIPVGDSTIKQDRKGVPMESELIMAIEKYDKDQIKALVAQGANVNARGGIYNWTPLQTAAMLGQKDTTELLLSKGAEIDNIFTAAAVGNVNTFKKFLPKGKFVNKSDGYFGHDIFYYAVNNDNIEVVKFLFDNGLDVNEIEKGVIGAAAYNENTEMLKLLLSKMKNYGNYALYDAIEKNNKEITELLLNSGMDVNKASKYGETPLNYALRSRKWEIAKILLAKGAEVTQNLLDNAARTVNADMFKLLLDKNNNADLNKLLNIAAINGNKEVLNLLAAKGVKANNITTLIALGNKQEVQNYLKNGKFKTVKNKYGKKSFFEFTEGADNISIGRPGQSSVRTTLLYIAVINNQLEIAKLLVKNGESINDGETTIFPGFRGVIAASSAYISPLWVAVDRNYMEMAKFLLDNKVNVNPEDNHGKTPFDYVKTEEMKQLLLKYGAKKGSGIVQYLM